VRGCEVFAVGADGDAVIEVAVRVFAREGSVAWVLDLPFVDERRLFDVPQHGVRFVRHREQSTVFVERGGTALGFRKTLASLLQAVVPVVPFEAAIVDAAGLRDVLGQQLAGVSDVAGFPGIGDLLHVGDIFLPSSFGLGSLGLFGFLFGNLIGGLAVFF